MSLPSINDLILYIDKAIKGVDWNSNWQKIVNWLTDGETDIKVNNVETSSITTTGTASMQNINASGNVSASGNVTVGGIITGDGSGITNIKSTSTVAYTPFSVNSAYIDKTSSSSTYGQELVMYKEAGYNNLIKFNVSSQNPLVATTSDGNTFKLEQLDNFDVSNTGNGTYVVCVKKGQQRAELKEGANGVYRQRLAPTDSSIPNNTLWLDTSTENIQCYERLNNVWTTKYDGVPLGEVVVASGVISSILVYHYNWNGYNINVQEQINIKERPIVMIKSYYADNISWTSQQTQTDAYEEYSNGLVVQSGRISWASGSSYSGALPLAVTLSKVCSVKLTPTRLVYDAVADGRVTSISGGTVNVYAGTTASHEGVVLWEVKGYK